MVRPRKKVNRRKPAPNRLPIIPLIITVVLIAATFFFLEKVKKRVPEKVAAPPAVTGRQKLPLPPRTAVPPPPQAPLSTARTPVIPPKPAARKATGSGNVAIIIDDMGTSVEEVEKLMAIKVPLSFAIIPGLPKMKEVAAAAHRQGYQVMIHLPMEPQGYPKQRLEANGLLLSQSDAELTRRLNGYFQALPQAVGANNHMGSHFTEERDRMRVVLGLLKEKGAFFIDSRTTPRSQGYDLARSMGLETATRDVFLDNVQETAAIRKQLELLAATARKRGSAIGICHPHKTTLQVLAVALPELQRQGITFVQASALVR